MTQVSIADPSRRVASTIQKDDARRLTRPLLHKLEIAAAIHAQNIVADPEMRACAHARASAQAAFCCDCGALVSVTLALAYLAPEYGTTYATQQILRGDAIGRAQHTVREGAV